MFALCTLEGSVTLWSCPAASSRLFYLICTWINLQQLRNYWLEMMKLNYVVKNERSATATPPSFPQPFADPFRPCTSRPPRGYGSPGGARETWNKFKIQLLLLRGWSIVFVSWNFETLSKSNKYYFIFCIVVENTEWLRYTIHELWLDSNCGEKLINCRLKFVFKWLNFWADIVTDQHRRRIIRLVSYKTYCVYLENVTI